MNLPNFFIVGAAKSGTTSLYHYLDTHPEVVMASYKEPIYYSDNQLYNDKDKYLNLFQSHKQGIKAVGEASTNYLAAPEAPKLIKQDVPNAKIVIMLRNPVKRAFSLYKWMVRAGFEKCNSFEQALYMESDRHSILDKKSPVYYNFFYYQSGLYSEQITRYFDNFGRDKCHIIIYEEFAIDTKSEFNKLCRFLDISQDASINFDKVYNQAKFPHSVSLQYYLRSKAPEYLRRIGINVPRYGNPLLDFIAGINSNLGKDKKINLSTYKDMLKKYQDDIHRAEELIQRELTRWWK